MPNQKLTEELCEPIIRKFEKLKVYSSFKDNIWGADLVDMQSTSKAFRFLLCVTDIYCRYAWVVTLRDEKSITITNAFETFLDESGHKPNKILVYKSSEFYNGSMKSWLQDNDTEMYSIHNEGKSSFVERFITTLKNKIYKYMTSISKNVYIGKLDDIGNEYSNTYNTVKINTHIDFGIENNDKDPKFEVGDHVWISKYRNIFVKGYFPNCSKEVFVIKKLKILCRGPM